MEIKNEFELGDTIVSNKDKGFIVNKTIISKEPYDVEYIAYYNNSFFVIDDNELKNCKIILSEKIDKNFNEQLANKILKRLFFSNLSKMLEDIKEYKKKLRNIIE
jgi:hypothetical protein